jgi:uncharacterized glyoxalase superfamily protein PhnB
MARVSTYLNFPRATEQAFEFYRTVFGGEFNGGSHINLEPDTRDQTDRLFAALAVGGKVEMPLQQMFWGAYFGNLVDRFGVHWMFNCSAA